MLWGAASDGSAGGADPQGEEVPGQCSGRLLRGVAVSG